MEVDNSRSFTLPRRRQLQRTMARSESIMPGRLEIIVFLCESCSISACVETDRDAEWAPAGMHNSRVQQHDWTWDEQNVLKPTLTYDEMKIIEDIQQEIDKFPEIWELARETDFNVDNFCIFRYARGARWINDIEGLTIGPCIYNTVKWRLDYIGPNGIHPSEADLISEKIYTAGRDNEGRPIIHIHLSRGDFRNFTRALIYTIELAIRSMKETLDYCVILNCSGYKQETLPTLDGLKEAVQILKSHYPGRLGRCFIINMEGIVLWIWKIISLLLSPVTKQRISMISTDQLHLLDQYLDADLIDLHVPTL